MQANLLLPDDVEGSLARTDRLVELCQARGITEGLAWADYHRTEALFEAGRWDEAVAAADRALELAEAHAYDRAALRTWFLRLPMAWHRAEREVLEHAHGWFGERESGFPDSPYSRIVRGAIYVIFTWASLEDVPAQEAEAVREGLSEGMQHPSWYLAVDLLFRRWLDVGMVDDARTALEILQGTAHLRPFRLEPCVHQLERAWVEHAAGATASEIGDAARSAAEMARGLDAPYWLGRSLAALGAIGVATDRERADAAEVARRLGLVTPLT
jgi:tetratricopeptide (TPR) repeat protein